jgi:hypothetical protein
MVWDGIFYFSGAMKNMETKIPGKLAWLGQNQRMAIDRLVFFPDGI